MSIDFSKWEEEFDVNEMKKSEKEAAETLQTLPDGEYTVKIKAMEIKASKSSGKPMLAVDLVVTEGAYKKKHIFQNYMLTPAQDGRNYGLHNALTFLRDLDVYDRSEVEFNGFADFSDLIADIMEEMDNQTFEVDMTSNAKGYSNIKVI